MRALSTLCKYPADLLHKLNGHVNALLADFRPVENGERGISQPPQLPAQSKGGTEECI
jgi:hypothetical protein